MNHLTGSLRTALRRVSGSAETQGHCLGAVTVQRRNKRWIPYHQVKKPKEAKAVYQSGGALNLDALTSAGDQKAQPVRTSPFQAVRLMQSFCLAPKDREPVFLQLRVNADLKRESVRGVCQLPHGLGADTKLLVFCPEDEAKEMIAAGADFAGLQSMMEKIAKGWLDFDRCLATPEVMPQVFKVAKILGPRKLMPNPKSGTVTSNMKEAIKLSKSGAQVEFRAEGEGVIRVQIANTDFNDTMVLDNIKYFVKEVMKARPRGGGSSSSSSGSDAVFNWPPPLSRPNAKAVLHHMRRFRDYPAIKGMTGNETQREGSSSSSADADRFVVSGRMQAQGGPEIRLEGGMLMPSSVGYFR